MILLSFRGEICLNRCTRYKYDFFRNLVCFYIHIRVVHGCHFWAIFESFLNHFPFHFVSIVLKIETENGRKMNKKWNPNLAVAKMDSEKDHFSSFWQCAWREKCIFTPFSFLNRVGCSR